MMSFADDKKLRDELREPFPKAQIGKLPATKGRPALDFVGHAAVTDRLNRLAPDWTYTIDELLTIGSTCWIKGTITIGGVSRPEYGDGANPKVAIGNFIRRGAMRFGVALDLWSREELEATSSAVDAPTARADDVGSGELLQGMSPGPESSLAQSPASDVGRGSESADVSIRGVATAAGKDPLRLTESEQRYLREQLGGQVRALRFARDVFGEQIHQLSDLTSDEATRLLRAHRETLQASEQ